MTAHASGEGQRPVYVERWRQALEFGIRTGPEDAPVQLIEFADFECPACAHFESTAAIIRERYPDQVAIVFSHSPLSIHRFAELASRAAECAHSQGRFDEMRNALFSGQRSFGLVGWAEYARQAGVPDIENFELCMADTAALPRVQAGKRLAQDFGAQGTPTILINGWRLSRPPSVEVLDEYVSKIVAGEDPLAVEVRPVWQRIWHSISAGTEAGRS